MGAGRRNFVGIGCKISRNWHFGKEEEAGKDEGKLQTKRNKSPSEDAGDKQRKSRERQKERIPKKGKRKGLGNSVIKITT